MKTSYGLTVVIRGTRRHWHWEWRTSLREITVGWAFWRCGNNLRHGVLHLGIGLLLFDDEYQCGVKPDA